MKIAHCLFTMETGGSQILAVELLNELCRAHEVSLVIINNKYNESLLEQLDKRVKVYFIKRNEGSKNPLPIIKLNWVLGRMNPDIIHCHEPKLAKIVKLSHPRLLYTIHDVGIPVSYYHLYDGLVAISNAVYEDVVSKSGFPVSMVLNGVSMKSYKRRQTYALQGGEAIRLVQVSRLFHEKKGQHILLQALHSIVYEQGFRNISLDLIGSGDSYDYLAGLVNTLKLKAYVKLVGEKDRNWLFAHLCEYHALVQPSLYEGFGLTILEGFAAGLPVLASDIDGPAEIVSKMPGGFLFKTGDPGDCAKALSRLWCMYENGETERRMQDTITLVQKKYSIESCASEYLTEYMKIAN